MAKQKEPVRKHGRIKHYLSSYNYFGIIFGSVFVYLGFGPSLLPRLWFMQALISGVLFSIGYGIGVFVSYFIRQFEFHEPAAKQKAVVKKVTYALLAVCYLVAMYLGHLWQRDSYELVNMDKQPADHRIGRLLIHIH